MSKCAFDLSGHRWVGEMAMQKNWVCWRIVFTPVSNTPRVSTGQLSCVNVQKGFDFFFARFWIAQYLHRWRWCGYWSMLYPRPVKYLHSTIYFPISNSSHGHLHGPFLSEPKLKSTFVLRLTHSVNLCDKMMTSPLPYAVFGPIHSSTTGAGIEPNVSTKNQKKKKTHTVWHTQNEKKRKNQKSTRKMWRELQTMLLNSAHSAHSAHTF